MQWFTDCDHDGAREDYPLEDALVSQQILRMLFELVRPVDLIGKATWAAMHTAAKDSERLSEEDREVILDWLQDVKSGKVW